MRLCRLSHAVARLCLALTLCTSLAALTPLPDRSEVAPGLKAPAGTSLIFEETELLNDEAKARLDRTGLTPSERGRVLLSQGLVGQAIDVLSAALQKPEALGDEESKARLSLASAYQQAGRFAEALEWAEALPEAERNKQREFIGVLRRGQAVVEDLIAPLAAKLRENPRDADAWVELSRAWLSPGLQVRRNALGAASAALSLSPDSPTAREAMAEALATYVFTSWTERSTASSGEQSFRLTGSRPPSPFYKKLLARINDLAPPDSMVSQLRDLYLIAAQAPGPQVEGARLELEKIRRSSPLPDARYSGYTAAVSLLAAEDSASVWEHYKALDANRTTQHYFQPLRRAVRPVALLLYDLAKPQLDDQVDAIKEIPKAPLPSAGDFVFWEGWRWIARGMTASREALRSLPAETVSQALFHLEKVQENHEADGALLGAIGQAWFTGYRVYSEKNYETKGKEFLSRSIAVLDAAAEHGIDLDSGIVRAAALRAAQEYDRAGKSVLALVDPGLPLRPTEQDRERVAAQWVKLGFLYLDFQPTPDSKRIAGNCFDRASALLLDSKAHILTEEGKALAGFKARDQISTYNRSYLLPLLPPVGAEVFIRLAERDTKLAYLELIQAKALAPEAIPPSSFLPDPQYHARLPLPLLALQVEDLVASPAGFPVVGSFGEEMDRRVNRAFAGLQALAAATASPKEVSKNAGLKGIEARALESQLVESQQALIATVNALHQAMAKGAAKKKFDPEHGNSSVAGGLHASMRLVDFNGVERKETPLFQVRTSWEDFLFSLSVGYLHWAAEQGRLNTAVLGLDALKQQVREVSPLRPNRSDELTAATQRFDAKMGELLRSERERSAAEEARKREAAERYARVQPTDPPGVYTVRDENGRVVGGIDFRVSATPTPRPYVAPQYEKPVERITCDVCKGSGVTYTQTDYSNSARQTCWRCKGKGWRSPHDM